MIRTIHLHEGLKAKTGLETVRLDVNTPTQLFNGLKSQVPNFRRAMWQFPNMSVVLSDAERTNFKALTPDHLDFPLDDSATDIHLVPSMSGGATAVVAFFVSLGATAATAAVLASITINLALSFAIGAVSQALAPSPKTGGGTQAAAENASTLYNGAVNVEQQGGAVKLIFGTHMTGSTVIAGGISVEEYGFGTTQLSTPPYGIPPAEPWQFGQ